MVTVASVFNVPAISMLKNNQRGTQFFPDFSPFQKKLNPHSTIKSHRNFQMTFNRAVKMNYIEQL